MASKYLQKYPVPAGFQEVLADFTREVLRDQPPNIIEYAAKYFEMLEKGEKFEFNSKFNVGKDDKKYQLAYNPKNAEEITKKATSIATKVNDAGQPQKSKQKPDESKPAKAEAKAQAKHSEMQAQPRQNKPSKALPQELISQLNRVFDEFDTNKNGFIDSKQIRAAIESIAKQSGINEKVDDAAIKEFIQVTDVNRDGKISREEFISFMGELLAPLVDSLVFEFQGHSEKTVNQQEVENFMDQQGQNAMYLELQAKFEQVFNEIDVDRNGYITTNEVRRAAQMFAAQTGQQPDEAQIAQFIDHVDTNNDGKISKEQMFNFLAGALTGDQSY